MTGFSCCDKQLITSWGTPVSPLYLTMNREEELERLIDVLQEENARLRDRLARAKDPEPAQKPSFIRVLRLARSACMEVEKVAGGYVLFLGNLRRLFRRLRDIWELLIQEDWKLSELFPQMNTQKMERNKPAPPRLRPRNQSLLTSPKVQQWWSNEKVPFS